MGGMRSRVGADQPPVDVDGLPGHCEGLPQLPGRVQVDGEDVQGLGQSRGVSAGAAVRQGSSDADHLPSRSQSAVQSVGVTQAGGLDCEGVGQIG